MYLSQVIIRVGRSGSLVYFQVGSLAVHVQLAPTVLRLIGTSGSIAASISRADVTPVEKLRSLPSKLTVVSPLY